MIIIRHNVVCHLGESMFLIKTRKKQIEERKLKIRKILEENSGQDALIKIFDIVSNVFDSKPHKLENFEKDICLIEIMEMEVNSGGFHSFFYHSYGDWAHETLQALENIGSKRFKEIFERAMGIFPGSKVPKNIANRYEIMDEDEDSIFEILDEIDDEFYKYEEDIHGLLIEYIKENLEEGQ